MPYQPDYRSKLFAVIADYEGKPFEYGKRDCAIFGGAVIEALTGTNPAQDFIGKYKTAKSGLKVIKTAGYASQADWLAKHGTEVPVSMAQFGDLAVIPGDENLSGFTIGVVGGSFLIAMREVGLVRLPLSVASTVYRVGGSI